MVTFGVNLYWPNNVHNNERYGFCEKPYHNAKLKFVTNFAQCRWRSTVVSWASKICERFNQQHSNWRAPSQPDAMAACSCGGWGGCHTLYVPNNDSTAICAGCNGRNEAGGSEQPITY